MTPGAAAWALQKVLQVGMGGGGRWGRGAKQGSGGGGGTRRRGGGQGSFP